jgi:hypothetical protein
MEEQASFIFISNALGSYPSVRGDNLHVQSVALSSFTSAASPDMSEDNSLFIAAVTKRCQNKMFISDSSQTDDLVFAFSEIGWNSLQDPYSHCKQKICNIASTDRFQQLTKISFSFLITYKIVNYASYNNFCFLFPCEAVSLEASEPNT